MTWFGTKSTGVGGTRSCLHPNLSQSWARFKQVILASSFVLRNLGPLKGSLPQDRAILHIHISAQIKIVDIMPKCVASRSLLFLNKWLFFCCSGQKL